jgi:hypothetical protein
LKSAQEIKTKALNLLKHSKVKITWQRSNVIEVRIEDLYQQHISINLTLIQEKGVSLYEAEKEELKRRKLLK